MKTACGRFESSKKKPKRLHSGKMTECHRNVDRATQKCDFLVNQYFDSKIDFVSGIHKLCCTFSIHYHVPKEKSKSIVRNDQS